MAQSLSCAPAREPGPPPHFALAAAGAFALRYAEPACRAPGIQADWWFPEPGDHLGAAAELAKAICGVCPFRVECLAGALARRELHGIWGGLDDQERMPGPRARACPVCGTEVQGRGGVIYCGDICRKNARTTQRRADDARRAAYRARRARLSRRGARGDVAPEAVA